jgi:hypothetical protein
MPNACSSIRSTLPAARKMARWRRFDFGLRDESSFRVAFSIANLGSFGNLRRQDRVF